VQAADLKSCRRQAAGLASERRPFAETAKIRGDSLNGTGRIVQCFTVDVLARDTGM
jgi:hypothetical protein